MSPTLSVQFKQQAIVKFLTKEGINAVDIMRRLWAVHGNAAISHSSVYERVTKFKASHDSL